MPLRYSALTTGSTTLNTFVAGTKVNGNALITGDNQRQKVSQLQALVAVTIVTGSLTVVGSWEGSNDSSTWVTIANDTQNAAGVTVTATATKSYVAPAGAFAWRFLRFCLTTAGATGAAGDLYTISYNYRT